MIDIPKNEYSQPSEVRDEVVQAICEAFTFNDMQCIYHPFDGSTKGYRLATEYVCKKSDNIWFFGSVKTIKDAHTYYRIRGVEMKRAFEELTKAGYYMFRVWIYGGSWLGYACHQTPLYYNYIRSQRVEEFTDRID